VSNCIAGGPFDCSTCSSGFYLSGGQCQGCNSCCSSCSGPGPNACNACDSACVLIAANTCVSKSLIRLSAELQHLLRTQGMAVSLMRLRSLSAAL
jgi:hypothetical protein